MRWLRASISFAGSVTEFYRHFGDHNVGGHHLDNHDTSAETKKRPDVKDAVVGVYRSRKRGAPVARIKAVGGEQAVVDMISSVQVSDW